MKSVIEKVAIDLTLTKVMAKDVIKSVFEAVADTLKDGETLRITGFGSFKVKEKAARTCRNPKTGGTVDVPAKKVVKFTAAKDLKETL